MKTTATIAAMLALVAAYLVTIYTLASIVGSLRYVGLVALSVLGIGVCWCVSEMWGKVLTINREKTCTRSAG